VTRVDGLRLVPNFKTPTFEWADCYVAIDLEAGLPYMHVDAESLHLNPAGARQFAAGLVRAADLLERLQLELGA
jgi:hypothetical protein